MIFEKQEYQQDCINNIVEILKDFDFKSHNASNLQQCLQDFYKRNSEIPIKNFSKKLNLDILMETGTGKTFTYLNLIFELHKFNRQNKFIIFVPRRAILESIKQNIELTKAYFYVEYQKYLKVYFYTDSKSQSGIINHYIKNQDELSVLVLTNSAIDKKDNILNKSSESLFNDKSIFENIIDLNPISIIDEPHLLKGEKFSKSFERIKSLYFRFGATFSKEKDFELSNMAYCLDSISAFKSYLVKQVKVHSISDFGQNNITLKEAKKQEATFTMFKNGMHQDIGVKLGEDLSKIGLGGVSLVKIESSKVYLSNNSIIEKKESYTLSEDEIERILELSIDLHFEKEQKLFSQNIKALSLFFIPNISDFRKVAEKENVGKEPFIKNTFERLYKAKRKEILQQNISKEYREFLQKDIDENGNLLVHQGYFSGDSHSKGNLDDKEAADIALILKDKEKLLSLSTPLRFIFSVWALQEGWDNPNIFTLTKLSSSSSEISTHQQVGRGLRLCVNNSGKRITHSYFGYDDESFYDINYLDIVISGKEVNFIENLQKEINDSSFVFNGEILNIDILQNFGLNLYEAHDVIYLLKNRLKLIQFNEESNNYTIVSPLFEGLQNSQEAKELLGDKFDKFISHFKESQNKHKQIINANKSQTKIKIKQNLAKDFKELWDIINKKATIVYKNIKEQQIINEVANEFNKRSIEKEQIIYTKKVFNAKENRIEIQEINTLDSKYYQQSLSKDITSLFINFARTKNKELPLQFLLDIYSKLNKTKLQNSPKKAFDELRNIIESSLHNGLLQSVNYDFTLNIFSQSYKNLFDENGNFLTEIDKNKLGKYIDSTIPAKKYLYEQIVYDSNIETDIAKEDIDKVDNREIQVFAKLPKLRIPTPYKNYEPDFAYFLKDKNGKSIFFVCETKGYDNESKIPQDEIKKIDYASSFFTQLNAHLKDENIKVIFNKRINKQNLLNCINEVLKGG
ncbi:DEAD/DEAH box helicase [Helicobacter muridarum]|uniref:DEAD/DEAH box helicase n=1 Tax=Helicobacter muridarum TaxID=216 RepID=A0A099U2E7_9HELI|nr:DEAD/DEAH box helicase family protein [Helicobacter muridarum]TLD98785.1 DEAD/DEAH box helicase [Helicobacter muridarum]STQ85460.1 type III restriction enzyme R protein [Helicobacter muridarum]